MRKIVFFLFAALLGAALVPDNASALDIEVPMEVPRLESISGQVPVGVGTAQIDLSLAFDPRGRIIRDEPCFVDGTPVDVKGKLVAKRSGRRYVITATGDGVKVKLKGVLVSSGTGTAKVSYKGPRGKAKATVTVDLRVVDDVTSTFTLTLDDQGGGGVTTAKGRISGTATVATGYLVPSPGVGTVRGRLKNGKLKLKAKHGPAALAFKGTSAVGGGYIGTLVSKVPPDAQKLTAFSIASIGRTGGGVVGGFSVGTSASSRLTVTSGSATIYTGRVGDIDAANFAASQYSFGLFTYVLRHTSGVQFEVLNYWVE